MSEKELYGARKHENKIHLTLVRLYVQRRVKRKGNEEDRKELFFFLLTLIIQEKRMILLRMKCGFSRTNLISISIMM